MTDRSDAPTINGWPIDDLVGPDGRPWCGMIEMSGYFWNHADLIFDAFDAQFREGRYVLIVDMRRVVAITDADPGALVWAAKQAHDNDGAIIVVLTPDHEMHETFSLLGLTPAFTFCNTLDAARVLANGHSRGTRQRTQTLTPCPKLCDLPSVLSVTTVASTMTTTALPIAAPGATLTLWPRAFEHDEALLDEIVAACEWRLHTISLFGKSHDVPRLTAWCGDEGVTYRYSGLMHVARGWPPVLLRVRDRVQALTGARFNSVLCNLYRDGRDSMGWHSDDEPELGPDPLIASVTLGHARPFQFRPKNRDAADADAANAPKPFAIELASGSLLLMAGETQRNWQHGIPKTKRDVGRRLNLTFRLVHPR